MCLEDVFESRRLVWCKSGCLELLSKEKSTIFHPSTVESLQSVSIWISDVTTCILYDQCWCLTDWDQIQMFTVYVTSVNYFPLFHHT